MILNAKSLVVAYSQALADNYLVATWVVAEQCSSFPTYLKGSTRLNIGLNTPVPIPDLCVDEEGISGTLSFNRVPHFVIMPWSAVQGFMSSEEADRQIAESKSKSTQPTKEDKRVESRDGNVVKVRFGK
jgi:hypothetical protein